GGGEGEEGVYGDGRGLQGSEPADLAYLLGAWRVFVVVGPNCTLGTAISATCCGPFRVASILLACRNRSFRKSRPAAQPLARDAGRFPNHWHTEPPIPA